MPLPARWDKAVAEWFRIKRPAEDSLLRGESWRHINAPEARASPHPPPPSPPLASPLLLLLPPPPPSLGST